MNFTDTMASVELVLAANQVPLLVGETGIGKTSLAARVADQHDWVLVTIDGNLLKEGEIGGLPTVETVTHKDENGLVIPIKTTVYAVHHTLKRVADAVEAGRTVLLFIDEINRAEHAVQQELMNLILNREINGFSLANNVHIIAAMNPEDSYDYQTIDMDPAQQNRFVWLYMNADYMQWIDWAVSADIESKVVEFISTYPDYLNQRHEDDIDATPRSFERVSGLYKIYRESVDAMGQSTFSREVFTNVIRGNVGTLIAEAFVNFVESDQAPLLTYDDMMSAIQKPGGIMSLSERINGESPTRLYVSAKNILRLLEDNPSPDSVHTFVEYVQLYPTDLMVALMKDLRNTCPRSYQLALEDDDFVNAFFKAQH
ncbi:MAG: AAA family ATPase [Veillonella sp.]|nr:AAA family ATPase [Veillonella sp.]